eukprot:UN26086
MFHPFNSRFDFFNNFFMVSNLSVKFFNFNVMKSKIFVQFVNLIIYIGNINTKRSSMTQHIQQMTFFRFCYFPDALSIPICNSF